MVMIMVLFNFTNFCVKFVFFTKVLTSRILFSTAVNAELNARPVILGILPSTRFFYKKTIFWLEPQFS